LVASVLKVHHRLHPTGTSKVPIHHKNGGPLASSSSLCSLVPVWIDSFKVERRNVI
jgi:hypothetical protein